jgi:hypothetical protein
MPGGSKPGDSVRQNRSQPEGPLAQPAELGRLPQPEDPADEVLAVAGPRRMAPDLEVAAAERLDRERPECVVLGVEVEALCGAWLGHHLRHHWASFIRGSTAAGTVTLNPA